MARMNFLLALAKLESTYGTWNVPSPTVATEVMVFRDVTASGFEAQLAERRRALPRHGYSRPAGRHTRVGRIQGNVPLAPGGAAGTAPAWAPLVRACGLAQTVVAGTRVDYTPVSAGFEGLSMQFLLDGTGHNMRGSRGTFGLTWQAGEEPILNVDLQGIIDTGTNPALATAFPANPAFSAWLDTIESRQGTTTLSVGGQSLPMRSLTYTHGNQVQQRDIPGRREVRITDRTPTLDMLVEAPDGLAPVDFFALANSGALTAVQVVHGAAAGTLIEASFNQVEFLPGPRYEADGDVAMLRVQGRVHPSAAGNDELLLRVR